MPRQKKRPAYSLHKPTGQARVRIDGRDHYLGEFGSPESRERYDDYVSEWLTRQDTSRLTLLIDDLAVLYLKHADAYYRHRDGTPTGEVVNIRIAMRFLIARHGRTRCREFGPKALKGVLDDMIAAGICRKSINIHAGRIRRMFKWAAGEELIPGSVWTSLKAVDGLRAGRTKAKETAPVPPVSDATVDATLPHLSPIVADMVRLQLLTGARPGEICSLRPGDVTRGIDGVWTYRPQSHKTEHHGKERRIFIGPQAQSILAPYMLRDSDAYCFTPGESESRRNRKRREDRKSPLTPSQAARTPKGRRLRNSFTKDAFNRSIQRACEAAFGMPNELRDIRRAVASMKDATPKEQQAARVRLSELAAEWRARNCWSPNQLRHNRATLLRSMFGIEAAQVVLGHSDPKTTLIYAEAQFGKAAEIARQIG